MPQQKITQVLERIKTEVFIDTIEAECHSFALISKDLGWMHEGNGDFWTKAVRSNHGTVFLTFKPDRGSKGSLTKKGNIKVKFSVPKFFYGDNFTGMYCSDYVSICNSVNQLLADEFVLPMNEHDDNTDFSEFRISRVDRSICSDAVTAEQIKEMQRLFSPLYFPYHKPGKRCSQDYDYETSFCHTSDSEDILCYDKSVEFEAHRKKRRLTHPKMIQICRR